MPGYLGRNTRLHARLPSSFLGMDAWMTSKLNVALVRKQRVIYMLELCFDISSMGVCTARHWQMSGRLVQEIKVCTQNMYRKIISSRSGIG